MTRRTALPFALLSAMIMATTAYAADQMTKLTDIAYGAEPKQKLDIYLPPGDGPFPVMFGIHGGGWNNGDKKWLVSPAMKQYAQEHGCAIVSVEYRTVPACIKQGITPPVMGPFGDAKRALQFIRLNAAKWKLDGNRVALFGGSAGACSALWLGLSPDLADPKSDDPVLRQSTRVQAIGGWGAQTSLDPKQMREWVGPELTYGGHAFGVWKFDEFYARRDEFARYFPTISPAAMLSPDDPPIHLYYGYGLDEANTTESYFTHHPRWGIGLAKLAEQRGATCTVSYKGHGPAKSKEDVFETLVNTITASR